LKGKKQTDAEYELAVLRHGVRDHVVRLSAAVSKLRLSVRQTEVFLQPHATTGSELGKCFADAHGEIDLIYDTMLRVRWAALGVRPAFAPEPGHGSTTIGKGGEIVPDQKPIVYVVDDNASVRKALSRLFRSVNYQSEVFVSARDFLQAAPGGHPACVVLDVRMPRMSGLDLQHELANLGSDLPIVFITGHGDIDMAVQAMKDGAIDFLPKPFDDQDLLDSVERAIEHHLKSRKVSNRNDELSKRMSRLTPREQEVFERVIKGMLNKQIGFELGTTEKTIKVHRGRVMEKMEAESLADLVRMAGRLGIEGPSPLKDI
jgi:FixJ family two-component response regulator